MSSRNQGVRVILREIVDYHMLTSVKGAVNPSISTVGVNFLLYDAGNKGQHHKSTYYLLTY